MTIYCCNVRGRFEEYDFFRSRLYRFKKTSTEVGVCRSGSYVRGRTSRTFLPRLGSGSGRPSAPPIHGISALQRLDENRARFITKGAMKASLVGYFIIGLGVIAFAWLVPDVEVRQPLWLFVFFLLAICAWYCWVHPKAPRSPAGWLQYAVGAVVLGGILGGIDMVVYGAQSGHVMLDVAVSAFGSLVAVSGAARSFILGEHT